LIIDIEISIKRIPSRVQADVVWWTATAASNYAYQRCPGPRVRGYGNVFSEREGDPEDRCCTRQDKPSGSETEMLVMGNAVISNMPNVLLQDSSTAFIAYYVTYHSIRRTYKKHESC